MKTILKYNKKKQNYQQIWKFIKILQKIHLTKKLEYFLGILTKSKYDGVGRKIDSIDISMAIDISCSMKNFIDL